jgi:hypothetical protein
MIQLKIKLKIIKMKMKIKTPLKWPEKIKLLNDCFIEKSDNIIWYEQIKQKLNDLLLNNKCENIIISYNNFKHKNKRVCIYFKIKKQNFFLFCQKYNSIEHNIEGIIKIFESFLNIKKYLGDEYFLCLLKTFSDINTNKYTWFDVLQLDNNCDDIFTVKQNYHKLVKQHHPDTGGNVNDFLHIQKAYNEIIKMFDKNGNRIWY